MYNYAPTNYQSPFALLTAGIVNEHVESRKTDVIYEDDEVLALISSWQFIGTRNAGHALVVPRQCHENLYDLPLGLGHKIHNLTRDVALAMKEGYHCDGVTVWQNNGPAAQQTVWHYHVHVIPRFDHDSFFILLANMKDSFKLMVPEQRREYAQRLREALGRKEETDNKTRQADR